MGEGGEGEERGEGGEGGWGHHKPRFSELNRLIALHFVFTSKPEVSGNKTKGEL